MTPLQVKIHQYIQNYINQKSYSPSLVEIATGIGISPKSISLISRNIHALIGLGALKNGRKGYRAIEVVKAKKGSSIPLLGRIAAGTPIEAISTPQVIDLDVFSSHDHFALQVLGESMIEDGIFDGDYVICKPTMKANEGDIVVALIDGQDATLKRISYQIKDRVTLIPANANLKPKAYLPHRVQVQGIFIGLLRLA